MFHLKFLEKKRPNEKTYFDIITALTKIMLKFFFDGFIPVVSCLFLCYSYKDLPFHQTSLSFYIPNCLCIFDFKYSFSNKKDQY